jgi:hypothetical protein
VTQALLMMMFGRAVAERVAPNRLVEGRVVPDCPVKSIGRFACIEFSLHSEAADRQLTVTVNCVFKPFTAALIVTVPVELPVV